MSDVHVRPAFQSTYPDSGEATKFGPAAWNADRLFSGGVDGQVVTRDSASPTGASWANPSGGGGGDIGGPGADGEYLRWDGGVPTASMIQAGDLPNLSASYVTPAALGALGYTTLAAVALAGFVTASSATAFTNKSGAISQWTNDAGYLTPGAAAADSFETAATDTGPLYIGSSTKVLIQTATDAAWGLALTNAAKDPAHYGAAFWVANDGSFQFIGGKDQELSLSATPSDQGSSYAGAWTFVGPVVPGGPTDTLGTTARPWPVVYAASVVLSSGTLATQTYVNAQGFVTGASATAFTNKTGNISQWTNDAGFTTPAAVITYVGAQNFATGGGTATGTNTGDQNLSSYLLTATAASTYVPLTRTVNGSALSANVTISTITGNAGTATAFQTPRTINGVSFDGTANITVPTGVAWGAITGTLSSQTDLNTALGLKAPLISPTLVTPILGVASGTSLALSPTAASGLTVTGATETTSQPLINLTQGWNANVAFTAIKLNVTRTLTNNSALLIDLQVGAASKFSVSEFGNLFTNSEIAAGTHLYVSSNGTAVKSSAYLGLASANANAVADTVFFRDAAGVMAFRNTTTAQKFRIYNTFTTVDTAGEWFDIDWKTTANTCILSTRKGSSTGTLRGMQVAASAAVPLGFYGATPITRAVLATGASATVDNVITALQNLGLVSQT